MEDFGQYLKQLREAAGMSRPDVRYEVHRRWGLSISEDTLILWEAGKTPGIPAIGLAALTRLYGASFDDVFGRLVSALGDGPDSPVPTEPPPGTSPADVQLPKRRAKRPNTGSKRRSS